MSTSAITGKEAFAHGLARRGFFAAYRSGEVNRCPGCGRTHWHVGRLVAECGFCATALPLIDTGLTGAGLYRHSFARAA